jgi:hypothetical protein
MRVTSVELLVNTAPDVTESLVGILSRHITELHELPATLQLVLSDILLSPFKTTGDITF